MSGRFLPYAKPCLEADDRAAVDEVLRSGWLTTGPKVEQFEQELAKRLDVPEAVACASGTAALHLAYLAAGIGPGHRVLPSQCLFCLHRSASLRASVSPLVIAKGGVQRKRLHRDERTTFPSRRKACDQL